MGPSRLHHITYVVISAIVLLFASPMNARAQLDTATQLQAQAFSTAVKANPDLVKDLAKELGSTPEQAAGAAGLLFGIAKSLLPPDDFAKISKAVPGMDALLAAVPADVKAAALQPSALAVTPGFASPPSSAPSSSIQGASMAAPSGIGAAIGGLSKLGIKPEMMIKAVPFLSGYLKKHAGAAVGTLLGGVFKTGK